MRYQEHGENGLKPKSKRPHSWRRFQAELPDECWQADTTHWTLADGSDVEILNILDDGRVVSSCQTRDS